MLQRAPLALLLGSLAVATTAGAAAVDVEFGAEMRLEWAIDTGTGDSQKLELVVEPELEAHLPAGFALTAIARLRGDAYDRLEPGAPRPQETSSISHRRLVGTRADVELRELYLTGEIGPLLLTLGKQQVVWGQADGLKLLDVVDPQDFREFILPDFEDSRIPLWTVNLEVPIRAATLQLLWIPDPSAHELPEPDSLYAFTAPRLVGKAPPGLPVALARADRPRRFVADSDAGAKLAGHWRGWDLSLHYLYHYDDRPRLSAALGSVGGALGVVVTPEYERSHLVGATFSNAFGDLTVRGEAIWESQRWLPVDDPSDADGTRRTSEVAYVLGLDWFGFEETLLSLQVFQSWLVRNGDDFHRDALDTNVTFLAQRDFWNDAGQLQLIWLHNLDQGDGLVRPKLRYELRDGLFGWIGVDWFYGSRNGLFGQYDARDRAVLGFEWGF